MSSPFKLKLAGYGVVLIFWLIVGFSHFPAPWVDDAFFAGTAINLAEHNEFSNPLCESLPAYGSTTYFFSAMPLHSYVLAVWLKLFGISTFSFHLFSTLMAYGAATAIYRFFPATRLSWLYAFLISFAVYGLLGGTGLRMDGLALLLFALGLNVCRSWSPGTFFLGNLLLALVVITLPSLGLIALLVSGSVFIHRYLFAGRKKDILPLFLAMAFAYGLVFLFFLWCIDGRLTEFNEGLAKNELISSAGIVRRFHFFTSVGLTKWVAAEGSFLLLLAFLLLRIPKDTSRFDWLFFIGVSAVGWMMFFYSSLHSALAPHIWAFTCLIIALWVVDHKHWGIKGLLAWAFLFALTTYGNSHVVIQDCLADAPTRADQREQILSRLAEIQPKRIYIDTYTLREIYDYRVPEHVYSYEWSLPIRKGPASDHTVAIVSAGMGLNQELGEKTPEKPRVVSIFGHPIRGVFKNVYDLVLIENHFE